MTPPSAEVAPVSVRLRVDLNALLVRWPDAHGGHWETRLGAALLRQYSPSADMKAQQRQADAISPTHFDKVRLQAVAAVGNYAVRLTFSDGHRTGIYTWSLLWQLSKGHAPTSS